MVLAKQDRVTKPTVSFSSNSCVSKSMNDINNALAALAFEVIFSNLQAAKISVYGKMQVKFRHLPFTLDAFLSKVDYDADNSAFQRKLNLIAKNYFWNEVSKRLDIKDCEAILEELNPKAYEQYQEGLLENTDVVNLTLDALAFKMKECGELLFFKCDC